MIAGYLKRTTLRGNYSYRRRIPKELRSLWLKDEEKLSLKTKHHPEALRLAAMANTQFEEKARRLRLLLVNKALPTEERIAQARDILIDRGIHPDQRPKTRAEANVFFNKQDEFKDFYVDSIPSEHGYNKDGSIWTKYVEDPANPYAEAIAVLEGAPTPSILPTVKEATEMYIRVNAKEKQRTPILQKKHYQRIWRAINALGKTDALITDFSRIKARRHKEVLERNNPDWKAATLNKTISMLSAVFAAAIYEYELTMTNPWSGIKDKVLDKEDTEVGRRGFTPEELSLYVDALDSLNAEARLIGLLMVYTGCRTMEAAGLQLGELYLQNNTPFIELRPNQIRRLKNNQSRRKVPLVDNILDELRPYLAQRKSNDPKAPVFPRYGRDGGMDAVSQLLNGAIRKRLGIIDPTLVAYSSRHTMKDKMRAVRSTIEYQHAILGHGSRTDADNYGEGERLRYLLEELVKANAVKDWGNPFFYISGES